MVVIGIEYKRKSMAPGPYQGAPAKALIEKSCFLGVFRGEPPFFASYPLPFRRCLPRLAIGGIIMFRITAIALAALTLAATAPAWGAGTAVTGSSTLSQDEEPKVDASKVRYGKLADVDLKTDKIGVVNSKKVYLEIPAYKTIVKDKV